MDPPPNRKQRQTHNLPTDYVEILTAEIGGGIYFSLSSRGLFPEEKKEFHKGSRGKAELLYIDQHILNESKIRRKNLAMSWIDYKKSKWYGSAKLDNKLPQNVQNIEKTMKTWNWQRKSKAVYFKEMHYHRYYL